MPRPHATVLILLMVALSAGPAAADLRDDALAAAKRATGFYLSQVSYKGGYLWKYSADLKLREGEGKQPANVVWIQPPGTPAMGEAYVLLYEATGERAFLDAALAAADVLRRGQLRSGGWNEGISDDPAARARWAYRIDPPGSKKRNYSSLDDDRTQASLRFLMQLDRATEFKHEQVHEMTMFALAGLLRAQYPNGGFGQVWADPYDPAEHPVKAASYPDEWSREYQGHQNYWYRYTLNDDLMPDLLGVLTLAIDIYGDDQYERAMRKAGDFLILAQMPEPQPAWAQQYNWDMQPIWARKFEPASITGGESQGAIRTLMEVYRRTGDRKYLKPIPRALAYLRRSQLPDGRLARFYELKTNRPLYFTRDYTLTHDDSDMPTHYGFKVSSRIDRLEREYEALAKLPADKVKPTPREAGRPGDSQVRRVIAALDDRGAWVTQDKLRFQPYEGPVIDMRIAVDNLQTLAAYLRP